MNPILVELMNKYKADINAYKFENLVYDSLSKGVFDEIIQIFEDANLPPKVFSELTSITTLPRTFSISTASMPSYLRKAHFAVWLRKFSQLLEKIIDSRFPKWDSYSSNISIEFSNEEKSKFSLGIETENLFMRTESAIETAVYISEIASLHA